MFSFPLVECPPWKRERLHSSSSILYTVLFFPPTPLFSKDIIMVFLFSFFLSINKKKHYFFNYCVCKPRNYRI